MDRFNDELKDIVSKQKKGPEISYTEPKTDFAPMDGAQEVSFNFHGADVVEVIRMFMDIIGDNYNLHEGIQGKVSLHLEDKLSRDQLIDLLYGLLRMNNMTMVKSDSGTWQFFPLSETPEKIDSSQIIYNGQTREHSRRGQFVQAFTVRYVAVKELVDILKPFLSKGAYVYGNESKGLLMVSDYPSNLRKVKTLIDLFDVSVFADLHFQIYTIQYVKVEDLVKELDSLAQQFNLAGEGAPKLSFLGLARLNMLLVLSQDRGLLDFADAWVQELDRQPPQVTQSEPQENIYVYYVQNGNAKDIVETLSGLFTFEESAKDRSEEGEGSLLAVQNATGEKSGQPQKDRSTTISSKLAGPVNFVVDETTNAILIRCHAQDYQKIRSVIQKLDIYPKQVLIEVMIAEVQLDESNKLGIEWEYIMDPSDDITSNLSIDSGLGVISDGGASQIGSGLTYLVSKTDRFTAALKAFADKNQVRILSSPHILASDNKEAKINIGSEVPIVTSELRTTEASSTATTVDKTVQYRNVGLILTVTPHINDNGLVRMELTQEISEVSRTTTEAVESPEFSQRLAETSLAVQNGQTIVIGGLMKQNQSYNANNVPGFKNIPILKYIFGFEGKTFENTELMLFITPHVIKNQEDSNFITEGFLKRLEEVKAAM